MRNTNRMNWIFEHYKPEIIYHTAAHKHVPLMETSPNEAIKNNVFGTFKTTGGSHERCQEICHDLYRQGGQSHEYHGSQQEDL
ncbi:MAG: polysaccharide biosynthesis protein [Lachnospiraceae bacterium]